MKIRGRSDVARDLSHDLAHCIDVYIVLFVVSESVGFGANRVCLYRG